MEDDLQFMINTLNKVLRLYSIYLIISMQPLCYK